MAARGTRTAGRSRSRRIGVLLPLVDDNSFARAQVGAFVMALQQAGWIEGQNARFEIRWAGPISSDIRRHAAELVALRPDVVLAYGSSTVGPLLQNTRTVPIVFPVMGDPVAAGYVESLARPGGNVTGFMMLRVQPGAKWLELLKEMVPALKRVAVLRNATTPTGPAQFGVIQAVSPYLKVDVTALNIRDVDEFRAAIAGFARGPNDGLIVAASALAIRPIVSFLLGVIARHKLPAIYAQAIFVADGGLMSYAPNRDRSVPSRQPGTSTASSRARSRPTCRCRRRPSTSWSSTSRPPRRSASTVPRTLLARADEVIE